MAFVSSEQFLQTLFAKTEAHKRPVSTCKCSGPTQKVSPPKQERLSQTFQPRRRARGEVLFSLELRTRSGEAQSVAVFFQVPLKENLQVQTIERSEHKQSHACRQKLL